RKLRYMSDSVFSFTDLPITVLLTGGVIGVVGSLIASVAVFAAWAMGDVQIEGYTPMMLVLLLLCPSILLALGIVGSYVWRTYENSKPRPGMVMLHHEHYRVPPPGTNAASGEQRPDARPLPHKREVREPVLGAR